MNTFEMKTAIHFGADALGRLRDIPYKRVLVITDPFVVKSGMIDMITKPLQAGGKEFDIFCDVVPDAPVGKIAEGVKKFLQYQPEAIVAVGGGSAIDSSKAIREFALKINNYGKVGLVAIPTTSGTGSEVTSFAVVNDTEAHVKYPLISDSLTADEAILDAELVRSVPPAITADTGMDVLTHAIESYVSNMASDYTDGLAEKAAELVMNYLEKAYNDGSDKLAREKMHNASTIAGMAFTNAFLGVSHSIAHKIGAEFHLPHGRINAILLPYVVKYNGRKPSKFVSFPKYEYYIADEKYSHLAKKLGLKADTIEEGVNSLVEKIKELNEKLNIPKSFKDAGIEEKEFLAKVDVLADRAFEDQCTTANPRVPLVEEIKQIMLDSYYGK